MPLLSWLMLTECAVMMYESMTVQTTPGLGAPCESGAWSRSALVRGFRPAFRHELSGEIRLSRTVDGTLASEHLLDGLPSHWIAERDHMGRALALVREIRAGYLRGVEFWTLADVQCPSLDS